MMRVPNTVNKNCLKAYEPEKNYAQRWRNNKIRSFSIGNWDSKIPKTLQELCVECIAANWTEHPILDEIILLEDRYLLLDLLSEDLPFELSIPKINDEIYWRKCYIKRWPKKIPKMKNDIQFSHIVKNGINQINESYICNALGGRDETQADGEQPITESKTSSRRTSRKISIKTITTPEQAGRTWKKYYCEMHVRDYLENLKPENYNPEKIKELCDLCGSYIEILQIDDMISSENSPNKIPLNAIITGLPNLTELSLRFKQAYAKEDFSWNIVNTSHQDICSFAKGLEKIRLQTLRITNSDIDCEKVIVILKALLKHDLEVLDFSHCKIGDRGMIAISKFVLENTVREIFLPNNRIGSKGIGGLAYAVAQESCNLKILDIGLNQFFDDAGNLLINSIVKYNNTLQSVSISGCGLTGNFLLADALKKISRLENLYVSNNALGEEMGVQILEALKFNSTLKKLDLRMCKIPSVIEAEIQDEVYKNRKETKKPLLDIVDDVNILWDEGLIEEIEEILNQERQAAGSPTEENNLLKQYV